MLKKHVSGHGEREEKPRISKVYHEVEPDGGDLLAAGEPKGRGRPGEVYLLSV